jgi:hypothetical protein
MQDLLHQHGAGPPDDDAPECYKGDRQ